MAERISQDAFVSINVEVLYLYGVGKNRVPVLVVVDDRGLIVDIVWRHGVLNQDRLRGAQEPILPKSRILSVLFLESSQLLGLLVLLLEDCGCLLRWNGLLPVHRPEELVGLDRVALLLGDSCLFLHVLPRDLVRKDELGLDRDDFLLVDRGDSV